MRTSVHYLSLLLFALPALSARYHIRSSTVPSDCIVSTGREKAGYPVITARYDENHGCPSDTVVNVDLPIQRNYAYGPVSGKSGLYIGRSKDGKYLEWVEKPHMDTWEFSHGNFPQFHIVQVPEHDEFWVNAGADKAVKVLGPGQGVVYWYFEEVHA
ncbi:hypothetical protein APHAL10511_006910 [Amanita phalloides]|nr:hypothetical protein APHAL10511_006910 [Amanita phalloides]